MLGLAPSRQAAAVATPNVYGAPLTGALFASLGMLAFGLLTFMPTTFDGTSVLRTLIALSLTAGGIFGVLIGYVGVSTRIEVGPDGVVVAAPGWRACPYPPVRQFELRWADLRAVRHRTEVYRIGPFPAALRGLCARGRRRVDRARQLLPVGPGAGVDRHCPPCRMPLVRGRRDRSEPPAHPAARARRPGPEASPHPGSAPMASHATVSGPAPEAPSYWWEDDAQRGRHGELASTSDPAADRAVGDGGRRAWRPAGGRGEPAADAAPDRRVRSIRCTLPLDADNDLVEIAGRPERAAGTILHLWGRVRGPDGRPVARRADRDLAMRRARRLSPPARPARAPPIPTSRASGPPRSPRRAPIASGRSSRCPIRGARRTSISGFWAPVSSRW